MLVERFVYLVFPWPSYNYSLYNFTHKPVICLLFLNCGLLVVSWRELNCRELVSYWLVLNLNCL
jgi:hypothetical protein